MGGGWESDRCGGAEKVVDMRGGGIGGNDRLRGNVMI